MSKISILQETPAIDGGRPLFESPFRFIKPTLPPLERVIDLYRGSYADGVITNAALVARFERECAEFLGVEYCVAVSSCTTGMAMILRALELSGEIIIPSFTFFATGHVALWNNLKPVLTDCDPQTWTLDPDDVERRITSRTSAILAVHLYGNPCDIERLAAIASKHNVKLLFDAAHAFGSAHRGRKIGGFGEAEIFSLSPTKLLVAGEGGIVATGDPVLARQIRAARNYGDLGAYDPELVGLSARMSEYNAALALAGLDGVERKVIRHNEIAEAYTNGLSGIPGLTFQTVKPGEVSTYKDYSIHIDARKFGVSRDNLAIALKAENIETKKYFYPPLHKQKLYSRYYAGTPDLSATDWVADGIISLPVYESLSQDTVEKIILSIRRLARN